MNTIFDNIPSTAGKCAVLIALALGGTLASTAAEAGSRVSFSIGVHGGYGGLYWSGGGHRHYGYGGGYGYGGYYGGGYGYGGYYGPGYYGYPYYGPSVNVVVPLVITSLPYGYRKVWVEGNPYYVANNVFYESVEGGYQVVPRPANEVMMDEEDSNVRVISQPQQPSRQQGQVVPSSSANGSRPVPTYAQTVPTSTTPTTATTDGNKLFAYPRNGQNPTQATFDRIECERWASGQTGFNPTQSPDDAQRLATYQRATGACLEGRGYTVK